MSRIRRFNESEEMDFEDYFKDKIDWKFFTYLSDKSVKYEDEGYDVEIKISVFEKQINEYHWVYKTKDLHKKARFKRLEATYQDNINKYVEFYEENGIYYEVEISDQSGNFKSELMQQLNREIKNRVIQCGDIEMEVIVQPISKG